MKDYKKSVKLTLGLTYFLMIALAVFVITLPYIATWYVEKMSRPARLATVTMLSCYPCFPFAVVALLSLRKLLKNVLQDKVICKANLTYLKRMAYCCFFAGTIMIITGFFYKPFFISGGSAIFISVIIKMFYDILRYFSEKQKEE
ncbi:MAG: DUF2975 domain-containing protein [Clostridia bacterium]|nr:DUF2975 domain-containing protein [Clostridia bacterium]